MKEKNNFDALRLVGAFLVLVSHQFALQGIAALGMLGHVGVAIFFGISGHLITRSWLADPNLFRFFAKRFLRIWPGLAFVVVALWAACQWLPWKGLDALRMPLAGDLFLRNLLMIEYVDWEGFFHSNPQWCLDGSLWTIPVEVRCYVAVALAFFALGRRARWLLVPAMALPLFVSGSALPLFSCFLAGSAMHLWKRGHLLALAVAIAAVVTGQSPLAVLLCVAPLAVAVGVRSWPALRSAGERGDFSYGAYLWAYPVAQVGVFLWGATAPWLFLWTLAATGAMAWLSWHLIESQALKLKPQSSQQLKPVGVGYIVVPTRNLPVTEKFPPPFPGSSAQTATK